MVFCALAVFTLVSFNLDKNPFHTACLSQPKRTLIQTQAHIYLFVFILSEIETISPSCRQHTLKLDQPITKSNCYLFFSVCVSFPRFSRLSHFPHLLARLKKAHTQIANVVVAHSTARGSSKNGIIKRHLVVSSFHYTGSIFNSIAYVFIYAAYVSCFLYRIASIHATNEMMLFHQLARNFRHK